MQMTSRILYRNHANSALGLIALSGTIKNSVGVPRKNMRILDQYAYVYMTGGSGRYCDAQGINCKVHAGDLILLFPGLAHCYGPEKGETWDEIYALFDGPMFRLWEQSGLFDRRHPIRNLQPIDYWYRRFASVVSTSVLPDLVTPLGSACRLQQVLADAYETDASLDGKGPQASWAKRAVTLLETDLARDIDIVALSHQLGMTYDSFRKRFTKLVGLTPTRYRAKRLMDRACELVHQRRLSDKQIAYQLGFCDEFHFSRRFKQLVGMSPSHFRKSLPS